MGTPYYTYKGFVDWVSAVYGLRVDIPTKVPSTYMGGYLPKPQTLNPSFEPRLWEGALPDYCKP